MNNIQHFDLGNGINFNYIPNSKFKTTRISFCMFYPLQKETASQNAVIPNLLIHSCKKYPSLLSISRRLEELYGASVSPSIEKIGDMQIIGISAQSINNRFVPDGSDNMLELTQLLCDMIFEPDLENDTFKSSNLELEKRQLKEEILAIMNDKKLFARKKCIEIMCEREKFGTSTLGDVDDIEKITPQSTFKAWQNLLSSAHIEITLVGSGSYTQIINEFKTRFQNIDRSDVHKYSSELVSARIPSREVIERKNVVQCKIVMGLRIKNSSCSVNYPAMKVMNALFGATPQSKLFVNVREKLSLCYYCASRYLKQKRIMLIESGVEQKNIQKAKENILEQLKDIQLGNFSDEELTNTKLFIIQGLGKIVDSLSSLSSWYLTQSIENTSVSPDEHIKEIQAVTREQIIEAANQLALDTTYILSGKEE